MGKSVARVKTAIACQGKNIKILYLYVKVIAITLDREGLGTLGIYPKKAMSNV
jgi:hypothetical protein